MKKNIRIGTRSSKLALWQANFIREFLFSNFVDLDVTIIPITTEGDTTQEKTTETRLNKGIFVKEIEDSLINKEIDIRRKDHRLKRTKKNRPDLWKKFKKNKME